jgi:hypothetical protein
MDDLYLSYMAQERDPYWPVVNTVMKVWVSQNEGILLDICGTIRI